MLKTQGKVEVVEVEEVVELVEVEVEVEVVEVEVDCGLGLEAAKEQENAKQENQGKVAKFEPVYL